MKAHPFDFAKVFANKGDIHYVLPHFQREYRWREKDWKTLWDDAILTHDALPQKSGGQRMPEHFLGALVVVPDGTAQGTIPVHRLVDGQQRLTTVSLLLFALADAVRESDPKLHRKIERLLMNEDEDGDLRFKLLPTTKNNDRATYAAVLEGKPIPLGDSGINEAFTFFSRQIKAALGSERVTAEAFFHTLVAAFQVVFVELDKDENPHQIFESLNTKGQQLGEADLVRNYIAMRLPSAQQERIFFDVWAPIEKLLSDDRKVGRSGLGELTAFLRHTDAMTFGVLPSERQIYARFRDAMRDLNDEQFIARLRDLGRLALLYDELLRPEKSAAPALKAALQRLNALDISTAYPFLLALSSGYQRSEITLAQFIEAVGIIENYLVRRFVVDEPTHYLNKLFASLWQMLDAQNLISSLKTTLSERKYPSDDRIRQIAPRREFYDKTGVREKTVMIFERINAARHAGSDVKTVLDGTPSLEHILPQTLSVWWKDHLPEAENLKSEWLHTLGNLTLVTASYNASLSNDSFSEKRAKLRAHGLKVNADYFVREIETWDENAIQNRADWLIEQILEIWPSFSEVKSQNSSSRAPSPLAVTIRGVRTETRYWADVMRTVGEFLVVDGADFPSLSAKFPFLISEKDELRMPNRLSNGWFLETHSNTMMKIGYCRRLLQFHGVRDDEWQIEEHSNG